MSLNGALFGVDNGGGFVSGGRATPISDVKDCHGKYYPSGPPASYPVHVVTNFGSFSGTDQHHPPPNTFPNSTLPRTGGCFDHSGHLVAVIALGQPGATVAQFRHCMGQICPNHSTPFLLDGGGSTQVIVNGTKPRPYPGFGNQWRPVHNWIVICNWDWT
jgi:hypothetical protein